MHEDLTKLPGKEPYTLWNVLSSHCTSFGFFVQCLRVTHSQYLRVVCSTDYALNNPAVISLAIYNVIFVGGSVGFPVNFSRNFISPHLLHVLAGTRVQFLQVTLDRSHMAFEAKSSGCFDSPHLLQVFGSTSLHTSQHAV